MTKKTLCYLIFVLFANPCMAQSVDFEPGYIVKKIGDTTRGYIELASNHAMSDSIHFKNLTGSVASVYTTESIMSFGFDIDNSHFRSVLFSDKRKSENIPVKKFAKIIMDGKASLYLLETSEFDESSRPELYMVAVFIVSKGEQYYTLRQSQSPQGFDMPPVKEYLSQLPSLFSDCKQITEREIKASSFTIKSISTLFRRYNNCNQPESVIEYKTVSKWTIIHEISGGYITSSSKSQDGSGNGFSTNYTLNFLKKGGKLQHCYSVGLMYRSNSFVLDYYSFVLSVNARMKQSVISLPLAYKYHFNNVRRGAFIGAGIAFGYSIMSSDSKEALTVVKNAFDIIPGLQTGWNFSETIGIIGFIDKTAVLKTSEISHFFAGVGLSVKFN